MSTPTIPQSGPDMAQLSAVARRARLRVLDMCAGRGQGYAGQGLALADVLAHLYFRVMRRRPDGTYLDRFVLSTGHSAIALFAILGEVGTYEQEELHTYGQPGSRIEESPLEGTPGFEITGGSLGQGLSQAVGMALGERLLGTGANVYCLVSDGELEEGQVWEAAMFAGHHRLGRLTVLLDANNSQVDGPVDTITTIEPIALKWAAFGWTAREVDGHDVGAILRALAEADGSEQPVVLINRTSTTTGLRCLPPDADGHFIKLPPGLAAAAEAELLAELELHHG